MNTPSLKNFMVCIYTGDEQPNKSIVKLNAFVNEKYKCTDNFKVETTKYRGRK